MVKTAFTGSYDGNSSVTGSEGSSSQLSQQSLILSNENHSLQITQHKLDGTNYLEWSQSVLLVIRGKGKLDYLTGDKPKPAATEPTYQTWVSENSMVMAWLVNSMEKKLGKL